MTPLDAQAIEITAAAAWSGTGVAAAFFAKVNARWGNIITSVVIAGSAIATLIGHEFAKARFLEGLASALVVEIGAPLLGLLPRRAA